MIHYITGSDSSSNHRRSACKKYRGYTIVRGFSPKHFIPYTEENGANTTSIWSLQTVTASIILYKTKEEMVRSFNRSSDFFDIVVGILQGDTLASYTFIVFLDYELRSSIDLIKENMFHVKNTDKEQTIFRRNYDRRCR